MLPVGRRVARLYSTTYTGRSNLLVQNMRYTASAILQLAASPAAAQIMHGSPIAVDGDSIAFGDDMTRLYGIDTVEFSQTCTKNGQAWTCGHEAQQRLSNLLQGGKLSCR